LTDNPALTANPSSDAEKRAQVRIAKNEVKKRESEIALAAYHAEARATEAKTARLRALRLAKEAADREAAASEPPPEKKVTRAKKKVPA
jgi:hypothetical protein